MSMRALHVYSGNLYGGVERFLSTIARNATLNDIEHQFALCFEGRLSRELRDCGAAVHLLGDVHTRQPWSIWRARRNLRRILHAGSYDVVICHSSWPLAIFGPVVRRTELPLIFYLHGPIETVGWVDRWASRTPPDRIIAVSRHTRESARKIFGDVEASTLHYPLPWPISKPEIADFNSEIPNRAEIRCALGVAPHEVLIIRVSRMDAWKGHGQSLDALAKLRDLPGWRCCIVGGAQRASEVRYVEQLKARAADLQLNDRVQFLGEREDIPRLLTAADIFLQANLGPEGFSIAFMEAFAAGLPIVTTRLGGAGELIDETCGVLAKPRDVDALAAGLRRLIANQSLRSEMSRVCRARVSEMCDPQRQLSKLSQIIAQTVERRMNKPTQASRLQPVSVS
jgi:glycosyltransferase involved in cell wall biosynthesis